MLNGSTNNQAVLDAFSGHNIGLDVAAMVAPTHVLSGRAPGVSRDEKGAVHVADILTRASRRDLVGFLGEANDQRFYGQTRSLGGNQMYSVRHRHTVPLDDISEALQGVEVICDEEVLVGESDGRAAALGIVSDVQTSVAEVQSFVHSLMQNDQIETDTISDENISDTTHVIAKLGDKRILTRRKFLCNCTQGGHACHH
jgi:hypothetical protein